MAMQVTFTYVEQSKLDSVPVTDGQLIAISDQSGYYYDMGGVRYQVGAGASPAIQGGLPLGMANENTQSDKLYVSTSANIEAVDGSCIYVINWMRDVTQQFTLSVSDIFDKPVYTASGARAVGMATQTSALFIYNTVRTRGGCWDMIPIPQSALGDMGQCYAVCVDAETATKRRAGRDTMNLQAGAMVAVRFNSAVLGAITLNVNQSGDFPVVYRDQPLQGGEINSGDVALFMFTGINYALMTVDSIIGAVAALQKDAGKSGIAWLVYPDASYADISAAVRAGQLPAFIAQGKVYTLSDIGLNYYTFAPSAIKSTSELLTRSANAWTPETVELATKSEVDAKYTKPQNGIPASDLAFTPVALDSRFVGSDRAAEAYTSGKLYLQSTYIGQRSWRMLLAKCEFSEAQMLDPQTGQLTPITPLQPGKAQCWTSDYIEVQAAVVVTPMYNANTATFVWAAYGYSDLQGTPTVPTFASSWVSVDVPLCIPDDSDTSYVVIAAQRADGQAADLRDLPVAEIRTVDMYSGRVAGWANASAPTSEFLTCVNSYLNQGLVGGTPTILDTDRATDRIDTATLVGLALRGYAYNETSYKTGIFVDPSTWVATSASWALDLNQCKIRSSVSMEVRYPVRSAAQLAEWLESHGHRVEYSPELIELRPGDLIFYACKHASTGRYKQPTAYRYIDSMAVCTQVASGAFFGHTYRGLYVATGTTIGEPNGILNMAIEDGYGATDLSTPNYNTIAMICRPRLPA